MSAAGLDMYELFYTPFKAAADAQALLTDNTLKFIKKFGLDGSNGIITTTICSYGNVDSSNVALSGGYNKITDAGVIANLGLEPYVGTTGKTADNLMHFQSKKQLTIPYIALFNVPALKMRAVTVDLALEIDKIEKKDSSNASDNAVRVSGGGGANWGVASFHSDFEVKATSSSQNTTSSTNATKVKYMVHMEAADDPPVGLTKILDWCMGVDNPPASDYSRLKSSDLFKPMESLGQLNMSATKDGR